MPQHSHLAINALQQSFAHSSVILLYYLLFVSLSKVQDKKCVFKKTLFYITINLSICVEAWRMIYLQQSQHPIKSSQTTSHISGWKKLPQETSPTAPCLTMILICGSRECQKSKPRTLPHCLFLPSPPDVRFLAIWIKLCSHKILPLKRPQHVNKLMHKKVLLVSVSDSSLLEYDVSIVTQVSTIWRNLLRPLSGHFKNRNLEALDSSKMLVTKYQSTMSFSRRVEPPLTPL
jgi:hypothetical protein